MPLNQLQQHCRTLPYRHQSQKNGEILASAPTSLRSDARDTPVLHDFLHTTTIAVIDGCVLSGANVTNACSAPRCASSTVLRPASR